MKTSDEFVRCLGNWIVVFWSQQISLDSLHFSHDHFGIEILIFLHDMGIFPHDGPFGAWKNVRSFGDTKKKQRLEMVSQRSNLKSYLFLEAYFDLISGSSLSMKIQIMGGKITESLFDL